MTIAVFISIIINIFIQFINYLSYRDNNHLLLSFRIHGGEITAEHGLGFKVIHIYGMTEDQMSSHSLSFSYIEFILSILVISLIIYAIICLIKRR